MFRLIAAVAATVKYGDQIIVESGALIEMILARHAPAKLAPALDSEDYPHYLTWIAVLNIR